MADPPVETKNQLGEFSLIFMSFHAYGAMLTGQPIQALGLNASEF